LAENRRILGSRHGHPEKGLFMKCDIPVPIERLIWFQNRLGLKEEELAQVDQYKDLFKDRKVEFSNV
jgi:hypothetical protein